MGFYLRKSVSVGPFRFNFSGSGVGVSAGLPGFRVGSGPRGNYVHLGGGGIYYRHTFPAGSVPARDTPPRIPITRTPGPMQEIESGDAAAIVDSSSEELLEEVRAKRRKLALRPFAITGALLLPFLAAIAGWPGWAMAMVALLGVTCIVAAGHRDRMAKTVVILYDFEPQVEEAFRRFTEWAQALAAAGRTWHVAASAWGHDRKYHAGASTLVQRHVTAVRTAEPPFVKTNVPVLSIGAGRQTLYFLPDRLLVYDAAGIGAISYRTLEISTTRQRFVEDGGVSPDATVVDYTWQYVNKSGGPDRRFRDNRQVPICLYDELTFRTPSGLHEVIQISRMGLGEGFAAAVQHLGRVTP
jgi:hypothetical protein